MENKTTNYTLPCKHNSVHHPQRERAILVKPQIGSNNLFLKEVYYIV